MNGEDAAGQPVHIFSTLERLAEVEHLAGDIMDEIIQYGVQDGGGNC